MQSVNGQLSDMIVYQKHENDMEENDNNSNFGKRHHVAVVALLVGLIFVLS